MVKVYLLAPAISPSLRGGFFSRGSNLTTIATCMRFKVASSYLLAMTTLFIKTHPLTLVFNERINSLTILSSIYYIEQDLIQ
jgi:hypothetical protein